MDNTEPGDSAATAPRTNLEEGHDRRGLGAAEEATKVVAAIASPAIAQDHHRTTKSVIDEWIPKLHGVRDAWAALLPPDAATTWKRGAAYIRVSSARSLVGDSPDTQLRNVLLMLAQKGVYVGPDAIFFDVESGTDIGPRAAFKRLFESALAGGFQAIGVFINERMFRNLEQATQIKRQFRMANIELVYLGMYEGDRRNPAAWQMETMQDTTAELHARNTSYYVGLTFEAQSRAGRPVGRLPEVYTEKERAASFLGRRGSILSWQVVEPLASIMQEGARRCLAGDSTNDLAVWATTTALKGVTPKGRIMDKRWWYSVLLNPKYAGYQMACTYTGYKPGIESPQRPRRTKDSELIPSQLPPLWTLEDHREIIRIFHERFIGAKVRHTFRSYLLSGIAFDAECGHVMNVEQHFSDGRYLMECRALGLTGRHSKCMRVDLADRELDELLSKLSFDDEGLQRQIEEELRDLARTERAEQERFRADPAIAALRQAQSLVPSTGMEDLKDDLDRRIKELEGADVARRDQMSGAVVDYRAAMDQLRNWREVWTSADVTRKNQLLRAVGLRVEIGRSPFEVGKRRPGRILGLSAANPVFELALATALSSEISTLGQQQTGNRPNVDIPLRVSEELHAITARLMPDGQPLGTVWITRPPVPKRRPRVLPPDLPEGPWLTSAEASERIGLERSYVCRLLERGDLKGRLVLGGRMRWWLVHERECERMVQERANRLRVA